MAARDDEEINALWDAYFTHPNVMDTEGGSERHNAMQQQISAFEKLLRHTMSHFSRDKYYTVLKTLSQRERSQNPGGRGKIQSVSQLYRIRNNMKHDSSRRAVNRDQDTGVVQQIDGIFEDLQHVKDLKKYFDEKIYSGLYQYFYDPKFETSDDEDERKSTTSRRKTNGTSNGTNDINFSELTDKQKMGQAISQMQDINTKWDALLAEDELDEYMFDSDSYHEIRQFKDFKAFELLLRLFPDLFVKAYKSIEVAKKWWTQASKVFPQEPRAANVEVDFNYKVSTMEHLVAKLEADIQEEEEILSDEQESLQVLKKREGRWTEINENCSKVEEQKQSADLRYNHMKLKRQSLVQELTEPQSDGDRHNQITDKLERLDHDMWQAYDKLQLLSFQLKILYQDLDVEMTVRPEMIRYLGSLEDKVGAIERSLSQKKNSKEESEKQLQAIRRNLRSMKDIMISRSNTELQPFERGHSHLSRDSNGRDNNSDTPENRNDSRDDRYEDLRDHDSDQDSYHHDQDSKEDANQTKQYTSRSDKKTTNYSSVTKPWKPKPAYVRRKSNKRDREN